MNSKPFTIKGFDRAQENGAGDGVGADSLVLHLLGFWSTEKGSGTRHDTGLLLRYFTSATISQACYLLFTHTMVT